MSVLRVLDPGDAEPLAALWERHREHLDPWSPVREERFYTVEGQLEVVDRRLLAVAEGRAGAWVVVDDDEVVGEINLSDVVHGAFRNGHVGYWLAADAVGKGLATRAVREVQQHAFEVLRLHRLQAGTLVHNTRSQAVLERTGFTRFGLAPQYLQIAGRWQDHVLYQCLSPEDDA